MKNTLLLLFGLCCCAVSAQNPSDLQQARQRDALADWLWLHVDACDALETADPAQPLAVADAALAQTWRPAQGAAEFEPLLYLHVARGWHLARQGRIWQSTQAYETARQIFETWQFADFEAVEGLYKPLGNHYTRLGDNEKALAIFQKALALGGDSEALAGLLNNIGLAHWNARNLPEATRQLERGLALPHLSAAKRSLLKGSLALVFLDASQPAAAAQAAQNALSLLPKGAEQTAVRARLWRTLGQAQLAQNQFKPAQKALETALRDGPPGRDRGKTLVALADCYARTGQFDLALRSSNAALTAVLPAFQPQTPAEQPDATLFYEENTLVEALSAKARAARLRYQATGDWADLHLALDCFQLANTAEQRLRTVLWYESSKLDLQATTRQRTEAALDVAWALYEHTRDPQYAALGLQFSEQSKAALLLDALHTHLLRQRLAGDPRVAELASLQQNAADLRRQLLLQPNDPQAATWRSTLDDLNTRVTVLQRELAPPGAAPSSPPGVAPPSPPKGGNGAAFPPLGGPGGAALEYFVSPAWVYIFVVNKGSVTAWHRVPNDAGLQQLAERWRGFFADPNAILANPPAYFEVAFQLHQRLWPAGLPTAAEWVVVPDGWLCQVPFEALLTARPTPQTNLRNAAYLIQNQNIRYAWSLATLQEQERLSPARSTQKMLAVAPGFAAGERGLSPLTAATAEWEAARTWQPDALLNAAASRSAFAAAAGRYRVLHLATHAFADATPRVELADQSLLLPEVYGLSLQADLVVLSACESGLGAEQAGEGVMSLSRAFAQAGAASLVGTLWSVNDRASADLCRVFYQQLTAGESISAALSTAKRQYLSNPDVPATRQSPYFWAGLVQVGADRSVDDRGGSWWWLGGLVVVIGGWWWLRRR